MGDMKNEDREHLRKTTEKIRELARQTRIGEIAEELFDLADRIDRMTELPEKSGRAVFQF